MCPEELVAVVTSFANAIAKDTPSSDLETLAVVCTLLKDTFASIIIQRRILEAKKEACKKEASKKDDCKKETCKKDDSE